MEFYWDLRSLFLKLHLSNDYLFSFLSGALSKKECWFVLSLLSPGRASDSRLFRPWIEPFVRLIFTAGAPATMHISFCLFTEVTYLGTGALPMVHMVLTLSQWGLVTLRVPEQWISDAVWCGLGMSCSAPPGPWYALNTFSTISPQRGDSN